MEVKSNSTMADIIVYFKRVCFIVAFENVFANLCGFVQTGKGIRLRTSVTECKTKSRGPNIWQVGKLVSWQVSQFCIVCLTRKET